MEKEKNIKNSYLSLNGQVSFIKDDFNCVHIDLINSDINKKYFCLSNNQQQNPEYTKFLSSRINDLIKELTLLYINIKAIWVIIDISSSYIINSFTNNKFLFHHIENFDIIWLFKPIIKDSELSIPSFASHYMGVGAVIYNSNKEILLVKETNTLKLLKDQWKIPTGLANKGEKIRDAVIREVYEETNLKIEYKGILLFREAHPYIFGMSDMFFVCLCECLNDSEIDLSKGKELNEYKWFNINDMINYIDKSKYGVLPIGKKDMKEILMRFPDEVFKNLIKEEKESTFYGMRFVFHKPKF